MINESEQEVYDFEDFRLDAVKRLLLRCNGEQIPLSPKVFDTLLYLVQHPGKNIEKDDMMSAIWADTIVEENNLSQNISILRRLLGEKRGEHRFIATIPGYGFKFVASVRVSRSAGFESDHLKSLNDSESEIEQWELLNESESSLKSQISNFRSDTDDAKPRTESGTTKRFRFAIAGVLITLALGSLGLYLWRGNEIFTDRPIRTIAVLPFRPLVAEFRDEALELGMADALISRLGDNHEIVIRPLSSVRKFGNLDQNALQAGRSLDVDSVLDGSIQHWGDKIRVNVRLLKVADGSLLWTGTFDENFTDIFVVQDAISNRVASALALRLDNGEKGGINKKYTKNLEAYQLYLKGRLQILKLTPAESQKGIAYFQEAIEIDPNYALAYVGLASAYRSLALAAEMPPSEFLPKAKAAAQKAIDIDETLAEAHAELGYNIFWYDWDWSLAESHDKRAIELNPNSSEAHFAYAHLLSDLGRHTEALAAVRRARDLDPLNLKADVAEGQFLLYAGQTDDALAKLQRALEIDPNYWFAHMWASSAFIDKGMYAEGISAADKALALSDVNTLTSAFAGYALARSDKQAEARVVLAKLLKSSRDRYVPPYNIALIYNGLGDRHEALAWLERGFAERDPRMVFLKVEPKWNNLREEPRFIDLMKRMNFE